MSCNFENVEGEPLINRLLHRVEVERFVPTVSIGFTKGLQGLGLRRRSEREKAEVGLFVPRFCILCHSILPILDILLVDTRENTLHLGGHLATLAAVSFVDDNGVIPLRK